MEKPLEAPSAIDVSHYLVSSGPSDALWLHINVRPSNDNKHYLFYDSIRFDLIAEAKLRGKSGPLDYNTVTK